MGERLIALLILFIPSILVAQVDAPTLNCATTNSAGDVLLSWDPPADPNGEFVSYDVWQIGNPDVYIGTIGNIGISNFTVPGPIGITQTSCYYITTNYNNGSLQVSDQSETMCAMFLSATPSSTNPGFVTLSWNNPFFDINASSPNPFDLYVESPPGIWTLHESIPFTSGFQFYDYEVTDCSALLNFQIQFEGPGGCFFQSNITGDIYTDDNNALPPTLLNVSVDSLVGDATLEWLPSSSPDLAGYIVYECLNGFAFAIDTLWDPTVTSYQYLASQANLLPEAYTIAAFDDCLLGGEPDPGPAAGTCHQSIFVASGWAACETTVELDWTAYEGWDNGVDTYHIYAQEEDSDGITYPSFLLGTTDGFTTEFTHVGANLSSTYRYRVEAFENGGTNQAQSNVFVQLLFYPDPPLDTRIATATVTLLDEIALAVDIDENSPFNNTYTLERKEVGTSIFGPPQWESLDVFTAGAGTNFIDFVDINVFPKEQQYDYRVIVQNGCGDNVDTTTVARPMLLTGLSNNTRLVNTLFWTEYQGWDNGISGYRIYRSNEPGELGNLLVELPGGVTSFEDDVSDLLQSPGEFCYSIEAIEAGGGITFNSFSNQMCLTLEPKIWVPNAFMVGGFNNVFNPVITFADFDRYRMIIYGRWGDIIYETVDIQEGWDGTFGGEIAPQGVYAYFVSVQDGSGQVYEERGTVTLLIADE